MSAPGTTLTISLMQQRWSGNLGVNCRASEVCLVRSHRCRPGLLQYSGSRRACRCLINRGTENTKYCRNQLCFTEGFLQECCHAVLRYHNALATCHASSTISTEQVPQHDQNRIRGCLVLAMMPD